MKKNKGAARPKAVRNINYGRILYVAFMVLTMSVMLCQPALLSYDSPNKYGAFPSASGRIGSRMNKGGRGGA